MSGFRIIALAAIAVSLLQSGCMTDYAALELDAKHPTIAYGNDRILIGEKVVSPEEVLDILEYYEIPKDRVIHIRVVDDLTNLRPARGFMGYLSHNGYHRSVLVTERHAESAKKELAVPSGGEEGR